MKTHLLPPRFFDGDAVSTARVLIGCTLLIDGVGGVIVETEAYDRLDPASHSFRGPTARNAPMFGPVGHAYVYRIYGMYWCLNAVCDAGARGSAVLIRALQPTHGLDLMRERRGDLPDRALCSGPGKLCTALGVTGAHSGLPLGTPPFELFAGDPCDIATGVRIGLTKAADVPWRFGLRGSPWISRRFP